MDFNFKSCELNFRQNFARPMYELLQWEDRPDLLMALCEQAFRAGWCQCKLEQWSFEDLERQKGEEHDCD